MELDVCLTRDGGSPWGFRLIGGKGLDLPITIIEVLPNSPAEKARLQNGDVITKIEGKPTEDLSLEKALLLIDEGVECLSFGIVRGLYDPVIDDQDPVFEEPADFDRRSEPTEVPFKIQNFDDPSQGFGPHYVYDEDGKLMDPNFMGEPGFLDNGQAHYLYTSPANFDNQDFTRGMSLEPFSDGMDFSSNGRGSLGFRESRSLTASPFSISSKPYRPFSTEPLEEIPPVEDPIILNPNFKDDFGYKFDERGVESVLNLPDVEPNFKLPKSEKYDPNWEENNKMLEEKLSQSIKINKIMNERLRKSAERVLKEINNCSRTEVTQEVKEIFESELKFESKKINISSWELSEQFKRELLEAKRKLKEEELNKKVEFDEKTQHEKSSKTVEIIQIKEEKELTMEQEIDLNQIEKTARNIVDESYNSVEEAVEVKQKEVRIQDMQSENTTKSNTQRKIVSEQNINEDYTSSKEVTESLQVTNEKKECNEEKYENVPVFKKMQEESRTDSAQVTLKQDFEETHEKTENIAKEIKPIEANFIESRSEEYEQSEVINRKSLAVEDAPKLNTDEEVSKKECIEPSKIDYIENISNDEHRNREKNIHFKEQSELKEKEEKITKSGFKENILNQNAFAKTQTDDRRMDSEQRVYSIGLQTIPNIRGVVHSQHYDLLLKTFFIHLTDVMVALSRFMLTQPVFPGTVKKETRYETDITQEVDKEKGLEQRKGSYVDNKEQMKEEYSSRQSKKEISKDSQQRKQQESYIENKLAETEIQEKKIVSSKKKAAMKTSQKNEEIVQKMDKVITEFQNKTEESRRIRRSSSRSSIEEEVALESDPLEWLDKVNSRRSSQEFTEINKKQRLESKYESRRESKHESRQVKIFKPKPGWQTYRAIVEAHVYTNPDVIFEDHTAEMLETASYETAESLNLASESNQAIITENIAVENAVSQEISTAKEQKGHTFSKIEIKNQATVESYEEKLHDVKNMEQVNLNQKAVENKVRNTKDIVVQETRDVIEPIINFKAETKVVKQATATKQEMLLQTAAENTEVNEISKHEFIDVKQRKTEKAGITRDNFTAIEISEIDAIKDEITELQLTKDKTVEAKKSLEIMDTTALEITDVAIESDRMEDLKISKNFKVQAEKAVDEITAIQVTEVDTEKDEITELKLDFSKEAIAKKAIEEAAGALEVSEVKPAIDEVVELKIEKQKEVAANQAFEEAKSITISETLADKIEISLLNIPKTKEAIANTLLEEGNAALQISEVKTEKDEIKEMKIYNKDSETARQSYEETLALQVSEINTEIAKQEIKELKIAKNKQFIAEKSIQEATAIQVAEYKSEKDDFKEFEVAKQREVTASELTEETRAKVEVNEVVVERDLQIEKAGLETTKVETEKIQDEFAELKIIKHQEIDADYTDELNSEVEITEVTDIAVNNEFEGRHSRKASSVMKIEESLYAVSEMNTEIQNEYAALNLAKQQILGISEFNQFTSNSSVEINQSSQTLTVNQTIVDVNKQTENDIALEKSQQTVMITEIDQSHERTPSPDLPTPLVDEYVFKLEIPLPKGVTPVPPDPSPVEEKIIKIDEDPHIVKKKLVPHIDLSIESAVFDPPLTSPEVKFCSPVYRKPGLRGGADRPEYKKKDIREIERKSSLLKSAIDQTIRSIEEYKEEVGMESKKEVILENTSKSESRSFTNKTIEEVSNGVKEVDTFAEDKISLESSIVKMVSNGLDSDNPSEEITVSDDIKEVTKSDFTNDDFKDNSLTDVEKHVEDIKKIVKNTENIANIAESKKNEVKIEAKETKHSPNTVIDNVEIKNEQKEAKSEIEADSILEKAIKTSENNPADILKEEIHVETLEVENENLKIDDSITKSEETNKEIKQEANGSKSEDETFVSEVDLEVKETLKEEEEEAKIDPLLAVRPVEFHPENIRSSVSPRNVPVLEPPPEKEPYKTETGQIIGTIQGIVDGLEDAVVDEEVAKELGKPGLPDEKIAELISGEAEMLREAHVMGLSRVISSHMHREDDSSVDFEKIKPLVESLKDSEVLKALNEELMRTREEKKKQEKRWTTFLQKPARPVPKAKGGYPGYLHREIVDEEPYKVKIVKQPKPKVAPDYRPEDFDTGPLPWEEREQIEAAAPPPNLIPEEPILVPEEAPEFLEAVDPLPESEIPDLEDTGIPLPPPPPVTELLIQHPEEEVKVEEVVQQVEQVPEEVKEETPKETMENNLVENLVRTVHNMVDPNASLEQQLAQMRAQLTALAELPGVIQQTLELVTRQLFQLSHQQNFQLSAQEQIQSEHVEQSYEVNQSNEEISPLSEVNQTSEINGEATNEELHNYPAIEEMIVPDGTNPELSQEEIERMKREEEEMIEEQRRTEKQKKEMHQAKLEQESRQLKQRPTPRVGKPKPVFGPLNPERPVVLPGGRRWRGPHDAYNEELIRETLTAQAELIQGKALGFKYESDKLPYDERVNFMKYEKPPVSLEHLKNSEVYKLIHDMDETPPRRVEMLTPVIAEADYRERCRSRTPNIIKPHSMPQQLMP